MIRKARVIPDSQYVGMFRVKWPDGKISDMVNLSRANDAAASFNASEERRQRGRRSRAERVYSD